MNIMVRLALRQMQLNKKRTMITLIGILLSVSMITAVAGFVASTQDMLIGFFKASRGDYHVSFSPVTDAQTADIAADNAAEKSYTEEADGVTTLFMRIKNADRQYERTAEAVAEKYGVTISAYNEELLAAEGVIAGDTSLATVMAIGIILGVIILMGSVIVISNAFYISAAERTKQFGLLKSVGATKAQIRQSVLSEGMPLALVGIPAGILFGFIIQFFALSVANLFLSEINLINQHSGGGQLYFRVVFSLPAVSCAAAVSLVTILLSAWFPARRAAKMTAIDSIRLAKDIRLKPNQVKTFGITKKLFGFEGALAAKTLKRNRGKYRAAVLALVVSIILFIITSGFGKLLLKSAELLYTDYGVNMLMNYSGDDDATAGALIDAIQKIPNAETHYAKTAPVTADLPRGFISEASRTYKIESRLLSENNQPVAVVALDDALFEEVCRAADVQMENFSGAVLINKEVVDIGEQRIEFEPFVLDAPMDLQLKTGDTVLKNIKIMADVRDFPLNVAAALTYDAVNIIIPQADFNAIAGFPGKNVRWFSNAADVNTFKAACGEIFEALCDEWRDYTVQDIEQGARVNRNITILMMIFVYGFIGMMTLIAVTSVVSTISTSIHLRRQEFAMLLSVGMTDGGLKRMLGLESLLYGLKAILYGVPIGFLLYALLYRSFVTSVAFAFLWPLEGIFLAVAAVLGITFSTMRYSSKRIARENIVEALKDSNL